MKKLITLLTIALFALAAIPVSVMAAPLGQWPSGACTTNYNPSGCYGGTCGGYAYYGYGYQHAQVDNAWSRWAPVRLKYHYPYSSGFTMYGDQNQWPAPYSHRY